MQIVDFKSDLNLIFEIRRDRWTITLRIFVVEKGRLRMKWAEMAMPSQVDPNRFEKSTS